MQFNLPQHVLLMKKTQKPFVVNELPTIPLIAPLSMPHVEYNIIVILEWIEFKITMTCLPERHKYLTKRKDL